MCVCIVQVCEMIVSHYSDSFMKTKIKCETKYTFSNLSFLLSFLPTEQNITFERADSFHFYECTLANCC